MAPRIAMLLAFLLAIAGAGALSAATPLKATMRAWKSDAAILGQMTSGARALDDAEAVQLLRGFVADARALASRAKGSNPEALDIKARFEGFAADAQLTIEALHASDNGRARYSRLRADCRSCHDVYAN